MPIQPQFQWSQDEDEVFLDVTMNGMAYKKPHIFATDAMVERIKEVWPALQYTGSAKERSFRRENSINNAHSIIEEKRKAHVDRLKRLQRTKTDRQIEVDKRKRQAIEAAKKAELARERDDLQQWQLGDLRKREASYGEQENQVPIEKPSRALVGRKQSFITLPNSAARLQGSSNAPQQLDENLACTIDQDSLQLSQQSQNDEFLSEEECKNSPAAKVNISDDKHPQNLVSETKEQGFGSQSEPSAVILGEPRKLLPPPRHTLGTIEVDFTKLEFAHLPAREKREEEIRLYKKAQQNAQDTSNSVDISERHPRFLKDKGDAMFHQNNFHAAINAYSVALDREERDSHTALTCRLNRAACHSRLEEHEKCVEDCLMVEEVLCPLVQVCEDEEDLTVQRSLLLKALARRAASQAKIGKKTAALDACCRALVLEPGNMGIRSMHQELETSLLPCDWDLVERRASARYSSSQFGAAALLYAELANRGGLGHLERAKALSRWGMCELCMSQWEEARGRFVEALEEVSGRLQLDLGEGSLGELLRGGGLCGCEDEVLAVVMKCLGRMASCDAHLKRFESACELYGAAAEVALIAKLESESSSLRDDADHMRCLMVESGVR